MKLRGALATITPYSPGVLKAGAVKLASNENPLGPSPRAIDRIREVVGTVSLYPDAGVVKLREALARYHGLAPENFAVGNGSDEILLLIAGAYMETGCNAVTSEATFSEYTFSTVLFGGKMKYAPMAEGRFQLSEIAKLVDDSTRVVFVCNPNNPTGTSVSHDELATFLEAVPSHVLVVADEAYREYVTRPDFPNSIELVARHPNLVVLRTFSKIYGLAGLRVGYSISTSEIAAHLLLAKEPFNVNLLAQEAALAALSDEEFLSRSVANNIEGRDYLYREFERLGLPYHKTDANFVAVDVRRDCVEVFRRVMDLGVTIRPLKSFGLTTWIRVTIGTPEQNRLFVSCLDQVLS